MQPALHWGGDDHRLGDGPIPAFELDLLDARSASFDLLRRDQDLPHVFVGLAEMLLQLRDALVQALEIVYEMSDLGMNLGRSPPSNSTSWMRVPRRSIFSAEIRICRTSSLAWPKCCCSFATRSCRRLRSSTR